MENAAVLVFVLTKERTGKKSKSKPSFNSVLLKAHLENLLETYSTGNASHYNESQAREREIGVKMNIDGTTTYL